MSIDLEKEKNADSMKLLLSQLKQKTAKVKLGGGEKKIESEYKKGKLTARERIDYLLVDRRRRHPNTLDQMPRVAIFQQEFRLFAFLAPLPIAGFYCIPINFAKATQIAAILKEIGTRVRRV